MIKQEEGSENEQGNSFGQSVPVTSATSQQQQQQQPPPNQQPQQQNPSNNKQCSNAEV